LRAQKGVWGWLVGRGQNKQQKVCLRYAEKEKETFATAVKLNVEKGSRWSVSRGVRMRDGGTVTGPVASGRLSVQTQKRISIQIGARSPGYKDPTMAKDEKNIWVAAGDGDLVCWLSFLGAHSSHLLRRTVCG
jgi:hypothetical protein